MRKLLVYVVTVLLASGAAAAQARGYYHDYGWRYDAVRERPHRDAYLVGGLLLGLAVGAALADRDGRRWRHDGYVSYYDDWDDDAYYWHGGYIDRYGYGPRYERDVLVYREVRRPVYRERVYYGPVRREYRYRYRGW